MAFTAFDIVTTAKNELAKFNRGEVTDYKIAGITDLFKTNIKPSSQEH